MCNQDGQARYVNTSLDDSQALEQNKNMQHRRGIDLTAPSKPVVGEADELAWLTLEKLGDQYTLGGKCGGCGRIGWLNRVYLESRIGRGIFVSRLAPRLKCVECGNRKKNTFVIGRQ